MVMVVRGGHVISHSINVIGVTHEMITYVKYVRNIHKCAGPILYVSAYVPLVVPMFRCHMYGSSLA